MKFQIGQTLWYVPLRQYGVEPLRLHDQGADTQGFEVKIARVGTKYLDAVAYAEGQSRYKLYKGNLSEVGYHNAGRAYLTREEFLEHRAANCAWIALRAHIRGTYAKPNHLTADAINAVIASLKKPALD